MRDPEQTFHSPYQVGQRVIDLTAQYEGWPDVEGEIIEVDGSNVRVRYTSSNERWKKDINLCIIDEN